jgi:O-antigen/teichoic acid export membrane protein
METFSDIEPEERVNHKNDAARKQIRGSSLLLAGKFISVGLKLASQVLVVRYLSQSDFGAFGYAMAIVGFFHGFSSFGLKRAITRFVPIYHENDQYAEVFGTILLTLGTILITGLVFISAVYISPETISRLIGGEDQPVRLLLILIFFIPVEAIDVMLIGLFASFASPRVIFTRKYLFGPIIRLLVVMLLILMESDVVFLAYGYLSAGVIGIIIYSWVLIRLLRKQGIFQKFDLKRINIPAKEIFAFTIPLLTSDLVLTLMHSSGTFILGYFHGTTDVAQYRVILHAAHFNKIVMTTFAVLYTPSAARLFARNDYEGINHLYWQTAIWLGVLSFPIFMMTFCMAKPLTLLLYGARYETSWLYLQLMSFGYYFNVVLGFNGLTLKVLGKVRYVVIINTVAVCVNILLNLLLIPRYGALGTAIAAAASMVLHNILKQAGLRLASGISVFDRHYSSFYLVITVCALGMFLFQLAITNRIAVLLPIGALVSLLVIRLCHKKLNVQETFPELLRLPMAGFIFGLNNK